MSHNIDPVDKIVNRIIGIYNIYKDSIDKEERMLYAQWNERVGNAPNVKHPDFRQELRDALSGYDVKQLSDIERSTDPQAQQGSGGQMAGLPPSRVFEILLSKIPTTISTQSTVRMVLREALELSNFEKTREVYLRPRYNPMLKKRQGVQVEEDEPTIRNWAVNTIIDKLDSIRSDFNRIDNAQKLRSVLKRMETKELIEFYDSILAVSAADNPEKLFALLIEKTSTPPKTNDPIVKLWATEVNAMLNQDKNRLSVEGDAAPQRGARQTDKPSSTFMMDEVKKKIDSAYFKINAEKSQALQDLLSDNDEYIDGKKVMELINAGADPNLPATTGGTVGISSAGQGMGLIARVMRRGHETDVDLIQFLILKGSTPDRSAQRIIQRILENLEDKKDEKSNTIREKAKAIEALFKEPPLRQKPGENEDKVDRSKHKH